MYINVGIIIIIILFLEMHIENVENTLIITGEIKNDIPYYDNIRKIIFKDCYLSKDID